MQTLADVAVVWWMIIAFYQYFDYITDQLIYNDSWFVAFKKMGIATLLIPTFPVFKIFTYALGSLIQVTLDEAELKED